MEDYTKIDGVWVSWITFQGGLYVRIGEDEVQVLPSIFEGLMLHSDMSTHAGVDRFMDEVWRVVNAIVKGR